MARTASIVENAKQIALKVESILRLVAEERTAADAGTSASLAQDVVEEAQLETLSQQIASHAAAMLQVRGRGAWE